MKWNWNIFFIKITSRQFWVWAATTAIAYSVLRAGQEQKWIVPLLIIWGAVTVIYLCGSVLVDAIGKAVGNADIKVGIGK